MATCTSHGNTLPDKIWKHGERGSGTKLLYAVQDYETIRKACLASGTLFEDPEFLADDSSIKYSGKASHPFVWKRPNEIVDDPHFIVKGFSRFDVLQGELGDCWLIAAVSNLTQDQELFHRVVPDDNSFDEDYAGVFHFRFWQFGKWIDVVVDDRLPTYCGRLVYMHSVDKNEFWSPLLEKAYAKLYGSYEALQGGSTSEALVDFTGGVSEMHELKEAPENFFDILINGFSRHSMMGCSITPDPSGIQEGKTPEGLIRGHAYSITKVQHVDITLPNITGKIPLLRIRNPWGDESEWNGPWSDKSKEWQFISEEVKQELGLVSDYDGEFWMSYKDYLKHFDCVEMCNLSPDSLSEKQLSRGKKRWEMSTFEGKWVVGVSAGGRRSCIETFHNNPQYAITFEDPDKDDDDAQCHVIVTLMQKNRRSQKTVVPDYLSIGFTIYKVTESDMAKKPLGMEYFMYTPHAAKSPAYYNSREVSCRFKLDPGQYVIIPATFEPNKEGEFLIRVFSECAHTMEEHDETVALVEPDDKLIPKPIDGPNPDEELEKLFLSVACSNQEIGWIELKKLLDTMEDEVLKEQNTNGAQAEISSKGKQDSKEDSPGILCGIIQSMCLKQVNKPIESLENSNPSHTRNALSSKIAPNKGFPKDICRSMVAMMDDDMSGKLGIVEFKHLWKNIQIWKAAFKMYDTTGSGKLETFGLRAALASAGYQLDNSIANALGCRYRSEADGSITFNDFIMCAVKLKTMIEIFQHHVSEETGKAEFDLDEWVIRTLYS